MHMLVWMSVLTCAKCISTVSAVHLHVTKCLPTISWYFGKYSHSPWVWEQGSSHFHSGSWWEHHVGWPCFYLPCSSDTVPHYITLFINNKGSNKWTQVTRIWEVPSLNVAWDVDYLHWGILCSASVPPGKCWESILS